MWSAPLLARGLEAAVFGTLLAVSINCGSYFVGVLVRRAYSYSYEKSPTVWDLHSDP